MPASSTLRLVDHRALWELVNECREQGDDASVWWPHLARGVASLTDTGIAVSGEIVGLDEGRAVIQGTGEWGWENGFDRAGWERSMVEFEHDPMYSPVLRRYFARTAKATGACLSRTDLMSDRGWYRSFHYQQVLRVMGSDHALYCFVTVPAGGHIGLTVGRPTGGRDFTGRERNIVAEVQRLITPLVGGPLARFAEPSPSELAPRVRTVLACLLEGDSDKLIAARLRLSQYTVNQYVKMIYAHFRVKSRTELLARWIRRGWGNRAFGAHKWTECRLRSEMLM